MIEDFTARLTKVSTPDGVCSSGYIDEETGKHWLKYVVDDRGFFDNLMLLSRQPATGELIDIALFSENQDEASAAVRGLNLEEQTDTKRSSDKVSLAGLIAMVHYLFKG